MIKLTITLLSSLLIGISYIAAKCTQDADCQASNSFSVCVNNACVHKPVFPQFPQEWGGVFVFVVFKGVSTIGGVGGGAIAIPLLMFFFGLTLKPATAISSFAIMLATTTKFLTSLNERNPDKP